MDAFEFLARKDVSAILTVEQRLSLAPLIAGLLDGTLDTPPALEGDVSLRVWCDGSCLGNPGRGGFAACFEDGRVIRGSEADTTNNRMEIRAAIAALEAVPSGARIEIITDSNLVVKTMTAGWKTEKNTDLWSILKPLAAARSVTWTWVRGHNGDPMNELADRHAREAASGINQTQD